MDKKEENEISPKIIISDTEKTEEIKDKGEDNPKNETESDNTKEGIQVVDKIEGDVQEDNPAEKVITDEKSKESDSAEQIANSEFEILPLEQGEGMKKGRQGKIEGKSTEEFGFVAEDAPEKEVIMENDNKDKKNLQTKSSQKLGRKGSGIAQAKSPQTGKAAKTKPVKKRKLEEEQGEENPEVDGKEQEGTLKTKTSKRQRKSRVIDDADTEEENAPKQGIQSYFPSTGVYLFSHSK